MNNIRHIIKLVAVIVTMLFCVNFMSAQAPERKANPEELATVQARHIAEEMKFDEATTAKFISTYCDYSKAVWALGPPNEKSRPTTDAEAENAIKRRFNHGEKMLELRKKYYKEYRKFLSPLQIDRVYNIEEQMMRKLQNRRQHTKKNKN